MTSSMPVQSALRILSKLLLWTVAVMSQFRQASPGANVVSPHSGPLQIIRSDPHLLQSCRPTMAWPPLHDLRRPHEERWPCLHLRGGLSKQITLQRRSRALSANDFTDPSVDAAVAKDDLFAQCGVRGMANLLSTKIQDLTEKKRRRKLSAEETDLYNILRMQERVQTDRKLAKLYNSSVIHHEIASIDAELHGFDKDAMSQETEDAGQRAAIEKLEAKRMALKRLAEELDLSSKYAAVKEVVRDESGELILEVANHSRWLDVMEDDKLDDVDKWELGLFDGPTSRYTTAWSKQHKGKTLHLESKQTVCRSGHPPSDEFMGSCRAETPLPQTGVHYFEFIPRLLTGLPGDSLDGGTYLGLVDGNVTKFDGCWELESGLPVIDEVGDGHINRRAHIMALHDACLSRKGQVSWSGGVRTDWLEGASYGQGDRVGVLVNMDTRTVNLYKNGKFLGKAWGDLPDEVYPFVTLAQPDASVEITFPRFDEEITREQRQSQLYLDFVASQPPKPPPLPPLDYMIRNTLEYKEPIVSELKKAIRWFKRHLQGKRWDLVTASEWIRLHKARWALWALGARGPPVTRFVNWADEQLVLRGDGNSPPRTEEEDAAFMRTDAARALVAIDGAEAPAAGALEGGEGGAAGAEKPKKASLPWSAYRKQQKALRREGGRKRRSAAREELQRDLDRKRAGRPDSAFIDPVWDKSKPSLKGTPLKAPAANNPRRARKEMEQRIKRLKRGA